MPTVLISPVFTDVEGNTYSVPLHFATADITTLVLAQSNFNSYETALENVSGCAITAASVTFPLTVDGGQSPDNGYNTRSGATLSFEDTDTVGESLYIPGVLDTKLINNIIDAADTDVAALIDHITNADSPSPHGLATRGSAALWTTYKIGRASIRKVRR